MLYYSNVIFKCMESQLVLLLLLNGIVLRILCPISWTTKKDVLLSVLYFHYNNIAFTIPFSESRFWCCLQCYQYQSIVQYCIQYRHRSISLCDLVINHNSNTTVIKTSYNHDNLITISLFCRNILIVEVGGVVH